MGAILPLHLHVTFDLQNPRLWIRTSSSSRLRKREIEVGMCACAVIAEAKLEHPYVTPQVALESTRESAYE